LSLRNVIHREEINMITVIKRGQRVPEGTLRTYIGRPSPLGNPFVMQHQTDRERELVCLAYEHWLMDQMGSGRLTLATMELTALIQSARNRPLALECYCAPKRCHGDFIKTCIDVGVGVLSVYPYMQPEKLMRCIREQIINLNSL
jgi:hypothetical protein